MMSRFLLRRPILSLSLSKAQWLALGIMAAIIEAKGAQALALTWIDGQTATLQALDKITARISTVTAPVGVSQFFGTLEITVERCAYHPPEEPPESAAFLTVHDRGYDGQTPQRIFAGWMFASSPAVSALEHPVYDITVLSCNAD